jgi:hypothetical protein
MKIGEGDNKNVRVSKSREEAERNSKLIHDLDRSSKGARSVRRCVHHRYTYVTNCCARQSSERRKKIGGGRKERATDLIIG